MLGSKYGVRESHATAPKGWCYSTFRTAI